MLLKIQMDPAELAAEQAALKVRSEEEVKASVIAEYGFDEEADAERIQKIVQREVENDKKLSTAIGQKIKHREAAEAAAKAKEEGAGGEPKQENLKDTDLFALMTAKVEAEDIEEVKAYAAFKKISVAEALKDKTLQTVISDRSEERRTAAAAQTETRPGAVQETPEAILEKAGKGNLPESDNEIEKLAAARMAAKKGQSKT